MDTHSFDKYTVTACELSELDEKVKISQRENNTLLEYVQFLEKEREELRNRITDIETQNNYLRLDAAKRKLYTSEMETNNRINERRLKELKQETDRLRTSNKYLKWEFETKIQRIRTDHGQELIDQATKFQTILDEVVSQNNLVGESLREIIQEKNTIISSVVRHLMTVHKANPEALMALVQSGPEN